MRSLVSIAREALQLIKFNKKNPFKTDLRTSPGMERAGGQSKTHHTDDGGFNRQGVKNLSRSANEFDLPVNSVSLDKSVDETEELWKDLSVGQVTPALGFGGRSDPNNKNK
ncbi:MAG: hypothetical protein Q8Q92_03465 [bacterium]|nr:hypothetical protein [bacterium]